MRAMRLASSAASALGCGGVPRGATLITINALNALIALAALAAGAGSAGCGYPEYGFVAATEDATGADGEVDVNDGAGTDGEAGDVADVADVGEILPTASCPSIALGQDLANSVSMLPVATPITIDGDGSEWCSLRAFQLDAAACNWLEPDPLPTWAAGARARVRLVWEAGADASSSALYLDVIVSDASLNVAPLASAVDQGASFTLYVGAVSPLTGAYDDVADQGATAFVFAPAQGNVPARAAVDVRGAPAHGLPGGVSFGARRVVGGYEIEAKFAWSAIAKGGAAAPVPALGQKIGLDLSVRVRDAKGTTARLLWRAGGVSPSSCPADPLPECDDRTWYTPKLGL
jgi:hypothetical protein